MSKRNYLWPLLVAVSLAVGVVVGGYLGGKGTPFSVKENSGRIKLNKLIDLIEHEYVDNVNTDSIIDRTVNNILSQLDPHSTYISRSEFEDVQNAMKGSFVGIGINYYVLNDTLAVVKPLWGGPSAEAGINPETAFYMPIKYNCLIRDCPTIPLSTFSEAPMVLKLF